jgi:hypothetical protein
MAVKTSGPLSFQDIVNEFGGTGAAPLSDYYRGGPYVPNTNANKAVGLAGQPIKLSQFYGTRKEILITFVSMYGGGGAGGNGMADGNGSGRNNPGASTYFRVLGSTTDLKASSGGLGGSHGAQGAITGGGGGNSPITSNGGGAGGGPNSGGGNATWGRWGAGGGGGGGDDGSTSYLNLYGSDAAGNAGVGGGVPTIATGTISIDVEITYVIQVGGGGAPSAYGNYAGGRGAPGYASFTLSTDNNTTTYEAIAAGDGSSNAHFTDETLWYLRIERNGTVYFSKTAP